MGRNDFLSFEEMKLIEELIKQSVSIAEIARKLNRSTAGISSHIKLNGGRGNYSSIKAYERKAKIRNQKKKEYNSKINMRVTSIEMQLDILLDEINKLKRLYDRKD